MESTTEVSLPPSPPETKSEQQARAIPETVATMREALLRRPELSPGDLAKELVALNHAAIQETAGGHALAVELHANAVVGYNAAQRIGDGNGQSYCLGRMEVLENQLIALGPSPDSIPQNNEPMGFVPNKTA